MNKAELKKYAVESRRELMAKVSLKAEQYGITMDNQELKIEENYGQLFVNDNPYPIERKHAFHTLQQRLKTAGYDQLIEEVAYTWFNRIIAIRYMEVNNYLPDRVNVLSSSSGKNEPDILLQYETMNIDVKHQQIKEWLQKGENEQAYRALFVAQCNSLNDSLPTLFEKINDYTELLLPDYLLDSEFLIRKLVSNDELTKSFSEVEVIGWIYQYYISEPKNQVFAKLKKNKKVEKNEIPAVTQLFTPQWIVKYMVENSLGKLWIETNPETKIVESMSYFVESAKQYTEVTEENKKNRYNTINIEEITIIDPCVGSGHILVYAFEILYKMYEENGYPKRDIPKLILEKNLYGLDIDPRAAQLASFALLMKAREKSRRILKDEINLNIYAISESDNLEINAMVDLIAKNSSEKEELLSIYNIFINAKNFGSILSVPDIDFNKYIDRFQRMESNEKQLSIEDYETYEQKEYFIHILKQAKILSTTFDIVITNPPYMGSRGMNPSLKKYLEKNFKDSKSDMFAVFMERISSLIKDNGFAAMITMESWMFLTKYEKLRKKVLGNYILENAVHMPYEGRGKTSLGINFGAVAFTLRNSVNENYKGVYQCIRYNEIDENGVPLNFPNVNQRYSITDYSKFKGIKGSPITYWIGDKTLNVFYNNPSLSAGIEITGSQHITANNEKFLRFHWEVSVEEIGNKWISYAKGGNFRRWFGNNQLIVDWSKEAIDFYRKNKTSNLLSEEFRFRKGITWTATTNGKFSARLLEPRGLFDKKGPALFTEENDFLYVLGYLNSKPVGYFLDMFSGTSDYQNIDIQRLPLIEVPSKLKEKINNLVIENINLSNNDWDMMEISPDYKSHPFIKLNERTNSLEGIYSRHEGILQERFLTVKENEEEINKIFIEIYGLEEELNNKVEKEEVTLLLKDRERDVKSFLSYFIGCVMGRYSLYVDGLSYAGGRFDESKYSKFKPNNNGLILLTDDHYFEDDIISRLREFLSVAFSPDAVDVNMQWLAESLKLKKNESTEERLRRYFLDEFFNDHCKTYQKQPIYWLVDSGKQKGLRTLIYMHRYQSDTMAIIRFEHLQEIHSKYQNEIDMIDTRLVNPSLSASDKRILEKSKSAYQKKIEELQEFDKKLATYANKQININLDDGVKVNYAQFGNVLAKIK